MKDLKRRVARVEELLWHFPMLPAKRLGSEPEEEAAFVALNPLGEGLAEHVVNNSPGGEFLRRYETRCHLWPKHNLQRVEKGISESCGRIS